MSDPKRIEDMSAAELLEYQANAGWPGGATTARVQTALQVRLAEAQESSARALVGATEGLVGATKTLVETTGRLVWATWGLVGATLALVLAEIILKLWKHA
jgi:hypothetical protein